jgi:hypothetical protein
MVPDGCTVVIGGLMREELGTTTQQVPFFGSLPGVGFLFRHKTETTVKKEIIVLITPHIVCEPDACCEGDRAAAEFHRRLAVYADQMSPLSKRYLGRKYYRLAQAAWARGDQEAALRFADLAVHFDPESRAAIDLRTDIWNGNLTGQHTLVHPGATLMHGMTVPPEPEVGPLMGAPPQMGMPAEMGLPPEMMPVSKAQPPAANQIADLRSQPRASEAGIPNFAVRVEPLPSATIVHRPAQQPTGGSSPAIGPSPGLDGDRLPDWVLEGLLKNPSPAPSSADRSISGGSPLLLAPGGAQVVPGEAK